MNADEPPPPIGGDNALARWLNWLREYVISGRIIDGPGATYERSRKGTLMLPKKRGGGGGGDPVWLP